MKRNSFILTLALIMICLSGCPSLPIPTEPTTNIETSTSPETTDPTPSTNQTEPSTTEPDETDTSITNTEITEPSTSEPTVSEPDNIEPEPLNGWQNIDGEWYFYTDGLCHTGWLELDDGKYWFREDGTMCIGWAEVDGIQRYFTASGALGKGWLKDNDTLYYLNNDGALTTGWTKIEENQYYFDSDGSMHTGWLEYKNNRYYFNTDGIMARGCVAISETEKRYFTSTGKEVILVNPWNYVPADYTPKLTYYLDYWQIAEECLDPLTRMIADCKAAGHSAVVVSTYRTYEYQAGLYQRRVQRFLDQGYSQEEAEAAAAMRVAIPGTSEHQLGLAMDIVDKDNQSLNKSQEKTATQQWLMEHCWEYGFILRYPNEKSDKTGIIYEPWHYRYVGTELALELRDSGMCLEEYLESLTP